MNLNDAIAVLRAEIPRRQSLENFGFSVVPTSALQAVLDAIEYRNGENWIVEVVVPEDGDPVPDVGPDPVVLPRAAVCNNWERWTEDE